MSHPSYLAAAEQQQPAVVQQSTLPRLDRESVINVFRYNQSTKQWEPAAFQTSGPVTSASSLQTYLQWNVMLNDWVLDLRMQRMLEQIKRHSPDVIGLQEVVEKMLPIILNDQYIREHYYVTSFIIEGGRKFGVLMLTKVLPVYATCMNLYDLRGRGCICLHYRMTDKNGHDFTYRIVTTHLDSNRTPEASLRKDALAELFRASAFKAQHSVLFGDMNMHWSEEETFVAQGWTDVWKQLKGGDQGYTYDSKTNAILQLSPDGRFRLDRIYLSSTHWRPASVEIIGTESYTARDAKGGSVLYAVSDHFGMLFKLVPSA